MTLPLPETFDTGSGLLRWGRMGSGDPLVLVHGTAYSSHLWREVAPALARHHTVHYFDHVGYGRSEVGEGQDLTLVEQGRRFAALLDHWDLGAPSIAAHDIGGAITLRALLVEGRTCADLTLFDAVSGGDWEGGLFAQIRAHPEVFAALPAHAHRAIAGAHLDHATHRGFAPGVREEHLAPWLGADGQAAYYRQYRQLAAADTAVYEDRLGSLDVPLTVLWGRHDAILPPEHATWLAERVPHADLRWIDDAGHLLSEDAPGQLVAHLFGRRRG